MQPHHMQMQAQMQLAAQVASQNAMQAMYAARVEESVRAAQVAQAHSLARAEQEARDARALALPGSEQVFEPALRKLEFGAYDHASGYGPYYYPDQADLALETACRELQALPSKPLVVSFEAMRVRRMAAAFFSMLLLGSGILFLATVGTGSES